MSKRKIIQIACPRELPLKDFKKIRKSYGKDGSGINNPLQSDFLNISGGFQSRLGETMIRKGYDYNFESWRASKNVNEFKQFEHLGVKRKVYPQKGLGFSIEFLKDLYTETRTNEVILQIHEFHQPYAYLLLYLFHDTPIILSHHGEQPPILKYRSQKNVLSKIENFVLYLQYIVESYVYKNVDFFQILGPAESRYCSLIRRKKIKMMQVNGVDSDYFTPVDQVQARRKLNLPLDCKIILYVARAWKLKGIDNLLYCYEKLKNKCDVKLVVLGTAKTDELYDEVCERADVVEAFVEHDIIRLYNSAADVYCMPLFDSYRPSKGFIYNAGPTVSLLEALSCGTPAVSMSLINFPKEVRHKIGRLPNNRDECIRDILEIFDKGKKYFKSREMAIKYYDNDMLCKRLSNVYDILFDKYFG